MLHDPGAIAHPLVRKGRPEAAAAIWNWRKAAAIDTPRKTSAIRLRGTAKALVSGVVGVVIYRYLSSRAGTLVVIVSGLMLIAALVSPTGLYRIAERGVAALAMRLGWLLNWIILPALFYGLFWPLGKLMRSGKRDQLQRFRDATRSSYWSDRTRDRVASANRRRQY